jgi:hypothetical protein
MKKLIKRKATFMTKDECLKRLKEIERELNGENFSTRFLPFNSRRTDLLAEREILLKIINTLPDSEEQKEKPSLANEEQTISQDAVYWNVENYSQNDFLELIKGLYESKAIIGKQKDIIKAFSELLKIEIKNPDQQLQSLKNSRNNDTEFKFIDTLKESLNKWKTGKKEQGK